MSKVNYFLVFILTAHILTACTSMYSQYEKVRSRNRQNVNKLNIGMTKDEVLETLGTLTDKLVSRRRSDGGSLFLPETQYIDNPFRTSSFERDTLTFELLYYYTDLKRADGAKTDDEMTPIVLINGRLAGWGWDFWEDTANKYELRIR